MPTPASPPDPRRVLLVAAGASFVAFLDVTVVNVAFPDLRAAFSDTSVGALSWVVSAYAVAFAALLTAAGRLADTTGRRRVFLGGLAAFTLASVLCSVAPGVPFLIAARVLQGAAAAAMVPAALGLVLAATPPAQRMAAVGAWGAAASVAAATGPGLGGLLVEGFGWRAVFLLNVPLGLALLALGRRVLPADATLAGAPGRRPDVAGTIAFAGGIALVVAGLTQSGDWGWTDPGTLAGVAGGVALIGFALLRSRDHTAPAVEVGLWRSRPFAVANAGSLLLGSAVFAWLLSGPLFLTTVWGYDVLEAGLAVSPGALTSAAAAAYVGKRATPRGQRAAIAGGGALLGITGLYLGLSVTSEPAFWSVWVPSGLLSGTAIGLGLTGLATASASALPPERFAAGTGLTMTARQLGGALGVAALAALLTARGPDADGFALAFVACGGAAALAGLTGLALVGRRPTPVPAIAVPR